MKFFVFFGMVLIEWHQVSSIGIEGQLTVIRNDCYERLAIGERLNPQKVYKMFDYNKVADCEMECTKDKETCRAFSIGIGLKGNGTCELSKEPIRETVDLKPIGTVPDTDFDLYIKKLDCQLVIEQPQYGDSHHKPSLSVAESPHDEQKHHYGYQESATAYQHNAIQDGYNYMKPQHGLDTYPPNQNSDRNHFLNNGPQHGYNYPKPSQMPHMPHISNQGSPTTGNIHQVQTMVSIASGPNSYLHPVHDIILSNDQQSEPNLGAQNGNTYNYGKPPPVHQSGKPYTHNTGGTFNPNTIPPYIKVRPPKRPNYEQPNYGGTYDERPLHDNLFKEYGPYNPSSAGNFYNDANPNHGSSDNSHIGHMETSSYGGGHEYYGGGYFYEKPSTVPSALDQDRPDPHPQYGGGRPHYDDNPRPWNEYRGNGEGAHYLAVNRRKYDLYEEDSHRFTGFPPSRKYPPYRNLYDYYEKPFPDWPSRYGSLTPYPGDYDKSNHQYYDKTQYYDYLFKPSIENEYEIDFKLLPGNRNKVIETTPPSMNEINATTSSVKDRSNDRSKNNTIDTKKNALENQNSIVTHRVGEKGQQITSIITLIEKACFRRAFAGKRIIRGLVRQLILCDTVEQCQQECADQKSFTCEGFNYRIDPTGRGRGECELLDLPLLRINIPRDLIIDSDYDVYTRDRNAASVNCRQPPSGGSLFTGNFEDDWDYSGSHHYADSFEYEDQFDRRGTRPYGPLLPLTPLPAPPPPPARRPPPLANDLEPVLRRPADRWQEDRYLGPKPRPVDYPEPIHHRPSTPVDGYLISGPRPGPETNRRHDYGSYGTGEYSNHHTLHESHRDHESSHRFHYKYHNIDQSGHTPGIHYLPSVSRPPYRNRIPPEPYIPLERPLAEPDTWGLNRRHWGSYGGSYGNFGDRNTYYGTSKYRDQNRYEENRRISYLPVPAPPPKDWGLYGGSYGNGGASLKYQGFGDKHSYKYWGFHKNQDSNYDNDRDLVSYQKPFYLPVKPIVQELDNFILPVEPRRPGPHNFIRDECSLRMAPGFRLHKRIVKKYYAVPNIYECELLCFKEKDFLCSSYAFRYTVSLNIPTDNCYLSERNFKELDYYTDLEPDRDFDIYTMNNRDKCQEPLVGREKDHSECFWRVRSGQRLDHTVVRDSLKVNSIVECQLECLKSKRFTCRAYSFRYGFPVIGGIIDNCQLTNWPFYELDPQRHFISEPGFEIYERGSFGHGCQPDHFRISGKHIDQKVKVDTVCYIGFAQAARLLPSATIKSLFVPTELDCKNECSKLRERSPLTCMTFSFRSSGTSIQSNCYLSHIMQRDLLPKVDYVEDPTSWLFTWDNYNPECIEVFNKKAPHDEGDDFHGDRGRKIPVYEGRYDLDFFNPQETWRVYSVGGWPCRRGTTCKENIEAGFWFCYLEDEDKTAWDYCCRPDHQCGLSQDYPYEWCYVGPERTQWRKCSDRYYPYFSYNTDRFEQIQPPKPWIQDTGYLRPPLFRPDRPPADPTVAPSRPSLDEYENQFDNQFLSPPKPGGFGVPRRWPISYLHKDRPLNNTEPESRAMKKDDKSSKISAIKNLIDVIKNNDFKNVEYHITNNSNKADDVLFVKIPLPVNSTITTVKPESTSKSTQIKIRTLNKRTQKSIPEWGVNAPIIQHSTPQGTNWRESLLQSNFSTPGYRKGYVVRTNVTRTRRYDFVK